MASDIGARPILGELLYTGLYEVKGSSRKYTGGQSRDQSAFENGAMWVRLRVCSVSRQDEWVVEEE